MNIKLAQHFSKTPGARYPSEGAFSAQDFREKWLRPNLQEAINKNVKLEIDIDGTAGIGTSFLEESFGGLIRVDKISYDDIKKTITIISNDDPEYIDEINNYLEYANENEF